MATTNSTKEETPELVLLMHEPLVVDADFLCSAYKEVLGLKLGGDTEFVTGQFPYFMFQTNGVLVSVTLSDRIFGDPEYHEAFPHHDLSAIQKSLGFLDRRRIAKHQGWIGACFLREQQPSGIDPYVHVGRALCPFALPDAAVGLVSPRMQKATLFLEQHGTMLRNGDVRQIFMT